MPRANRSFCCAPLQPASPAGRDPYQAARPLLREASLERARLHRIRGAYLQTARRIAGARLRLALAAGLLGVPIAGAAGAVTPSFVSPFLIPSVEGSGDSVWANASPAFADLDGAGDLDAFVGHDSGNTIFFENTGTAHAIAIAAPEPEQVATLLAGFALPLAPGRRWTARTRSLSIH